MNNQSEFPWRVPRRRARRRSPEAQKLFALGEVLRRQVEEERLLRLRLGGHSDN